MSDIVVSFKAQGETGLLKAIKLLDNAQKGLGNTNKKTEATYTKLNAKMLELASKHGSVAKAAKASGVSTKIFNAALKGNIHSLALVNASLKKTNTSMGLFGTLSKRNSDGSSNLALSFSTMRSKLLLVNFALGMGISQLAKFAQAAAKQAKAKAKAKERKNISKEIDRKLGIDEDAVSKKQQRFFGMVRAAQKGEGASSPEVAKVASEIGKGDA